METKNVRNIYQLLLALHLTFKFVVRQEEGITNESTYASLQLGPGNRDGHEPLKNSLVQGRPRTDPKGPDPDPR